MGFSHATVAHAPVAHAVHAAPVAHAVHHAAPVVATHAVHHAAPVVATHAVHHAAPVVAHHAVHHAAPVVHHAAHHAVHHAAPVVHHAVAHHAVHHVEHAYHAPKHNCSIVDVVEPAEVCPPTFETVCEKIEVPVKRIIDMEQCYPVTRTVCSESVDVIDNEICVYSYTQKTEATTAKTVTVPYEKVCDTQMVTVCQPLLDTDTTHTDTTTVRRSLRRLVTTPLLSPSVNPLSRLPTPSPSSPVSRSQLTSSSSPVRISLRRSASSSLRSRMTLRFTTSASPSWAPLLAVLCSSPSPSRSARRSTTDMPRTFMKPSPSHTPLPLLMPPHTELLSPQREPCRK